MENSSSEEHTLFSRADRKPVLAKIYISPFPVLITDLKGRVQKMTCIK